MPTCPHCLEDIKAGARKCPHCQTSLEPPPPEAQGNTVYVVDNGLLKFAKFVGGVLAVFILVGIYLFGFDIKEVGKKTSEAELQVQKALLEIERQKTALDAKAALIEQTLRRIETLEKEVQTHRDATSESAGAVRALVLEIRQSRDEVSLIMSEIRPLDGDQAQVAVAKREERGIGGFDKLWLNGSVVRFRFLDGRDREQNFVRRAVRLWAEHVNLTFREVLSGEAEIRISFQNEGSWSYIGTDALAIPQTLATINYGTISKFTDDNASLQIALHEFGHALGLSHEFQNPAGGEIFDVTKARMFFGSPPNNFPREMIAANFLDKNPRYPGARDYDPDSVMNMTLPSSLFKPGKEATPKAELSKSDKAYVAALYPKN